MVTKSKKIHTRNIYCLIVSVILVVQCLLISTPVYAVSSDEYIDGNGEYKYKLINNGNNAEIIECLIDMNASKIDIPKKLDGVKVTNIGEDAFLNREDLIEVNIPNSVLKIGNSAFSNTGLTKIVIPGSVDTVGDMAFFMCGNLKAVYILYGVRTIGDGAFAECTNLDTIAMAPSISFIEEYTFESSDGVTIQANPDSYADKYTSSETVINKDVLPDDSPSAYKYKVSDDDTIEIVEYVGTSVNPEIPDQINGADVTAIGDNAFKDKPIETIKLPNSLRTIGTNAFAGTKLTSAIIPDTVTGIGEGAFDDKKDLVLEGSCQALYDFIKKNPNIVFKPYNPGPTDYRVLTVQSSYGGSISGVKSGQYKKEQVLDIEAVPNYGYRLDTWTQSIENTIENLTKRKTKLTMPNSNLTISANFSKLKLFIEDGELIWYTGTDALNIPSEYGRKYGYEEDNTDKVPVTRIQSGAFRQSYNGGPSSINIPSTITTIDESTFYYNNINNYNYNYNLTGITVDGGNKNYSSIDGVLFNKDKTVLIHYPSKKTGANYTIPSSVTEIKPYAFFDCDNLTSVTIPNGVTTIGNNAFENCSNLISVNIANSVTTIGSYAFENCTKLSTINLPANLSTLNSGVFYNCDSITNINLPNSITTIGNSAFYSCDSLANIIIPTNTTTIGSHAFYDCSNLITVNITQNVSTIDSTSFGNCVKLQAITVDTNNNSFWSDGAVLYSKDKKKLIMYPMGAATTYDIIDGVEIIGDHAFYNCNRLTKVTIPNTVTTIGGYAFYNCYNISELVIPPSVTTIGDYAFYNCKAVNGFVIPDGVTEIGSSTFENCTGITAINIPKSVSKIGSRTFYNCEKLESITVDSENQFYCSSNGVLYNKDTTILIAYPIAKKDTTYNIIDSVENITSYAFAKNQSLQTLVLPSSLKTIGLHAFENCGISGTLIVPEGTTTISNYAFMNCHKLEKVDLPTTINSIGYDAFYNCSKLSEAIIRNNGNLSIHYDAFEYTPSSLIIKGYIESYVEEYAYNISKKFEPLDIITEGLVISNGVLTGYTGEDTDIVLSTDIKTIGTSAFTGKNITSIKIPLSVNTIKRYAFDKCTSLKEIRIRKSIKSIEPSAFRDCLEFEKFNVDSSNTSYSSIDGVLTNYAKTTLKEVPQAFSGVNGVYTLPSSITAIESSAFSNSTKLEEIIINHIKHIGVNTFNGAFKNPIKLTLNNVDDIDDGVFRDCTGITTINLPATITRIGNGVFDGCTNLTAINVAQGNSKFESKDGVLFTRKETEFDSQLIKFPTAREGSYTVPDGTVEIYDGAFQNCYKINDVVLPSSVAIIGTRAFETCNISSITVPEGVYSIGDRAFINTMLIEISLPESVDQILEGAFSSCDKLMTAEILNRNAKIANDAFDKANSNLTIRGYANSTAQSYANFNSIKFEAIQNSNISNVTNINLRATINSQDIANTNVDDIQINSILDNPNNSSAIINVTDFVYSDNTKAINPDCIAINIGISKNALQSVYNAANINNIKLNTLAGNVSLDKATIDKIIQTASTNNITISFIKEETTYTLAILDNGNRILNFEASQIPIR